MVRKYLRKYLVDANSAPTAIRLLQCMVNNMR